jgi:tetraacyldisaccharide 4'-kinase
MNVEPRAFVQLMSGARLDVDAFVARHGDVHAVAGIGNPARFAATLQQLGLRAQLHSYPDHHRFSGAEVVFDDSWPVVCTQKDAVKLRRLKTIPGTCWYLEIDVALSDAAQQRVAEVLRTHGIATT